MPTNPNLLALADYLDEKGVEYADKVQRYAIPFLPFVALVLRHDACRDWGATGYRNIEALETFAPGTAADSVARRYVNRPAERFAIAETLAALASALHHDSLAAQASVEPEPVIDPQPAHSIDDRNAAIIAARARGASFGQLASEFGLSKSTIHAIVVKEEPA
jgi:hypothetical protein